MDDMPLLYLSTTSNVSDNSIARVPATLNMEEPQA
jgi:hypothetical protein